MRKKKIIIIFSVLLLIVLLGGGSFAFYSKIESNKSNKKLEDKNEIIQDIKDNGDVINYEVVSELKKSIGDDVPKISEYINSSEGVIKYYLNEKEVVLSDLNAVNEYVVKVIIDEEEYLSKLIVVDEEQPNLVVKDLTITKGKKYSIKDFIKECSDNSSKDCKLSFKDEKMSKYTKVGEYEIVIIAKDESGNTLEKTCKLTIKDKKSSTTTKEPSKKEEDSTPKVEESEDSVDDTKDYEDEIEDEYEDDYEEEDVVRFVETVKEEAKEVSYKYGVTITKTTTKTYDVYSDGSKKLVKTDTSTDYDRSTFNATAKDLWPDAVKIANENQAKLKAVVDEVNKVRAEAGVAPLVMDKTLNYVATVRALEMGWGSKFSHTRPNGKNFITVFKDLGLSYNAGENIAGGNHSPVGVVTVWKNSEGHYYNMINSNYTKIGIGVATWNGRYFWSQILVIE